MVSTIFELVGFINDNQVASQLFFNREMADMELTRLSTPNECSEEEVEMYRNVEWSIQHKLLY